MMEIWSRSNGQDNNTYRLLITNSNTTNEIIIGIQQHLLVKVIIRITIIIVTRLLWIVIMTHDRNDKQ